MRAVVTGAASGLGHALTNQLIARGIDVVAIDRVAIQPREHLTAYTADLSDRSAVDMLIAELIELGPLDYIFHNAGISATGNFETIPPTAYGRLMTLNCETPMVMTSRLYQARCLRNGANIVFISSLSHATGYPGAAVYGASKDALAIYAKSITKSLADKNIAVLSVFPGPLRTQHAARHAPRGAKAASRMEPDVLAGKILKALDQKRRVLYPGMAAKIVRITGVLLPQTTTKFMRRIIFEKLDRPVY